MSIAPRTLKRFPAVYVFEPVLWDKIHHLPNQPEPGTLVQKVQPPSTPKNGTMGHCYAAPLDSETFFLCCENSLQKVR